MENSIPNLCATCTKKKNGTYGFICRPLGIRIEMDFGCILHSANNAGKPKEPSDNERATPDSPV